MAGTHDKAGRPIVVVTGMGIVTPLATGVEDNWRKLTAGESGIRPISRFETEGLKTRIAGIVDFVPVEPFCGPALCERIGEMGGAKKGGDTRAPDRAAPLPPTPRPCPAV